MVQLVLSSPECGVPLDALFISIYSQLFSLAGKVIEDVSSPPSPSSPLPYRRILWSFPHQTHFLMNLLKKIQWSILLEAILATVLLNFSVRQLSAMSFYSLFLFLFIVLVFRRLIF